MHGNVCLKARYISIVFLVKETALSSAITVDLERDRNPHVLGEVRHVLQSIEIPLSVIKRDGNGFRKASSMIARTRAFSMISSKLSLHAFRGQEFDEDITKGQKLNLKAKIQTPPKVAEKESQYRTYVSCVSYPSLFLVTDGPPCSPQ